MSETVAVTPPDQTVWWDEAAVTAQALAQLRLTAGDVDAARVGGFVAVAGELLNTRMDRDAPPPIPAPASWTAAIVDVTVQLYLGKDSPPADVDLAVAVGYAPQDPLAPSKPMMAGSKQRWGVG